MSIESRKSYALLLCVSSLLVLAAFHESTGQDGSDWIEREVGAIATAAEVRDFNRLTTAEERATFQEIFWLRRDPDLSTPENEFRDAFERRIEIADEQVPSPTGRGSRSDMGRVFLLFGFPSSVEYSRDAGLPEPDQSRPVEIDGAIIEGSTTEFAQAGGGNAMPRLQTWTYEAGGPLNLGYGLTVEFRAQQSFGYRLATDDALEEIAESVRNSFIKHPDIGYAFDDDGVLVPAAAPTGPLLAGELLEELLETGVAGGELAMNLTPGFFRSRDDAAYVPVLLGAVGRLGHRRRVARQS